MPELREVHEALNGTASKLLAINITASDKLADVKALVETQGITYPVLLDEQGDVAEAYSIRSIPTVIIIDKAGIVAEHQVGGYGKADLLKLLEDNR